MKKFFLLVALFWSAAIGAHVIKVATFDSGFGGYFTAKEIERTSNELLLAHEGEISVTHYGDTANAPYGEKTPEQIAAFSARGIERAFADGAETVFIACNTASTQFEAIRRILDRKTPGRGARVVSIIESSVQELKAQIDHKLELQSEVTVALLATPATIKAQAYVRALARAYETEAKTAEIQKFTQERWYKAKGAQVESASTRAELPLKNGRRIIVQQIGPANWVDMIEHGATSAEKTKAIARDLALLPKTKEQWDVVGEFCTHFPAIDPSIRAEAKKLGLVSADTIYIKQGPLMAQLFRRMMHGRLTNARTTKPPVTRAKIFISGTNLQETKDLASEVFPGEAAPEIKQTNF